MVRIGSLSLMPQGYVHHIAIKPIVGHVSEAKTNEWFIRVNSSAPHLISERSRFSCVEADDGRGFQKICFDLPVVDCYLCVVASQLQKLDKINDQSSDHPIGGWQKRTMPFIQFKEATIWVPAEKEYE